MVMECFYKSNPDIRGFRKRMYSLWRNAFPDTRIKEQRLLDQKRLIVTRDLISPLELDRIKSSAVSNSEDPPRVNQSVQSAQISCVPLNHHLNQCLVIQKFPQMKPHHFLWKRKDLLDQITLSMNRFTDICARRRVKLIQYKFDIRKNDYDGQ